MIRSPEEVKRDHIQYLLSKRERKVVEEFKSRIFFYVRNEICQAMKEEGFFLQDWILEKIAKGVTERLLEKYHITER